MAVIRILRNTDKNSVYSTSEYEKCAKCKRYLHPKYNLKCHKCRELYCYDCDSCPNDCYCSNFYTFIKLKLGDHYPSEIEKAGISPGSYEHLLRGSPNDLLKGDLHGTGTDVKKWHYNDYDEQDEYDEYKAEMEELYRDEIMSAWPTSDND